MDSYTNVLQLYPANEEAYQRASWLSHEVLFAFPDAFALNQRWLERHPDDLNVLSDFAEHFTTGRFAACAERLTAFSARPIQPGVAAALHVLTIPTLLALRQPAQVPAAIDALLAHVTAQTDDFRVTQVSRASSTLSTSTTAWRRTGPGYSSSSTPCRPSAARRW